MRAEAPFELWVTQDVKEQYINGFERAKDILYVHYDNCGLIGAYVFLGGCHGGFGGYVLRDVIHRGDLSTQSYADRFDPVDDIMRSSALPDAVQRYLMSLPCARGVYSAGCAWASGPFAHTVQYV